MGLFIEVKGRKPRKPITWSQDADAPFPSVISQDIVLLQADGPELTAILDNFSGIPCTKGSSQVWMQPFAGQIFLNLRAVLNRGDNYIVPAGQATGPCED